MGRNYQYVYQSNLTEEKLEKSAQPVSEVPAEEEFHPDTAEGDEEDKGEETDGLEVEATDVPVSIGMSSKLAVHTGPKERGG